MDAFGVILLKNTVVLLIFFFIGSVFLGSFSYKINQPLYRIFIQQLTGLCVFVFFTALYFTGGKTILLGFVLIFFGFLVNKTGRIRLGLLKKDLIQHQFPGLKILIVSISGLIVFTLISYFLFFPGKNLVSLPHMDYIYYAKISNYLISFGIETNQLEFFFPETVQVTPYHYIELWLNGGLSYLLGTNHLTNLFLVTIPYGLFLTWLGLLAFAESLGKSNPLTWLLAFFALFFIGIRVPALENWHLFREVPNFIHNPWNFPKLLPIFWFFIPALISIVNKRTNHAFLFLSALIIAYVSTIPGIVAVMALWFFLQLLNSNYKAFKESFWGILAVLFYPLFYFLFSGADTSFSENLDLSILSNATYWRTAINISGKSVIQTAFLFFPVLVLFVFNFFKVEKAFLFRLKEQVNFWGLIMVPLVASLFAWAVFHPLLDSMQFFANINGVIMLILFFGFSISLLEKKNFKYYLVLAFFAFSISPGIITTLKNNRSLSQKKIHLDKLAEAQKTLKGKNPIGVFFVEAEQYNSIFEKKSFVFTLGQELSLISSNIHLVSLSVFDAPIDQENLYYSTEKQILQSSTFFKFVENQKKLDKFLDIERSQAEFIKEFSIDYLVFPDGYTPPEIILDKESKRILLQNNREALIIIGR